MGIKLKVKCITVEVNSTGNTKLLDLSNYTRTDNVSYTANIENKKEILDHLGILNTKVLKYSGNFTDESYKLCQRDLLSRVNTLIKSESTYGEHIYFLPALHKKLYIIRVFYGRKSRSGLFSRGFKYELQQIIYIVKNKTFALFQSDEVKTGSLGKGAIERSERSKKSKTSEIGEISESKESNSKESDEESEESEHSEDSEENQRKEGEVEGDEASEKITDSPDDSDIRVQTERRSKELSKKENINDVEVSVSFTQLSKKLDDISECTEGENSVSK
jgi:hypothetical protein